MEKSDPNKATWPGDPEDHHKAVHAREQAQLKAEAERRAKEEAARDKADADAKKNTTKGKE